jgi:beta-lactamase superfamily II metal-dependent hydrolase
MSIIKSFSVGDADMFYIRHNSDNFTIIDCYLPRDREASMLADLKAQSSDKNVVRFISTHPDDDHLAGLVELDDHLGLRNFYCVANSATKTSPTDAFDRYCSLRDDPKKSFHISRGCERRWMNKESEERGSAGISVLWPVVDNPDYIAALADAASGASPNNISCIIKYKLNGGATVLWMGDLETDFMEQIEDSIDLPKVDVLFAPHHSRVSGKVPKKWLAQLDPRLIIVGEAPSQYLHYYQGYDAITQNSAGDLLLECVGSKVHIYASEHTYAVDYLDDEGLDHSHGLYYVGTLRCQDRASIS